MRYTTIIDVTEIEEVWRNHNARLIYLYMCLKCGYHDTDRDKLKLSIRTFCYRLDLSLSAVRHALNILQKCGLIVQESRSTWRVTKWIAGQEISKRKSKRQEAAIREEEIRLQEHQAEERKRAEERKQLNGRTSWQARIDSLKQRANNGDQAALKQLLHLQKLENEDNKTTRK